MKKTELLAYVDQIAPLCTEVSTLLWEHPETGGNERYSADLLRSVLKQQGFVIVNIPEVEHAFYAEYGAGAPVIAVLGEYDALPGLSQQCTTHRAPVSSGAPGQGCGHNLLGSGSLGATLALKKLLEENGTSGTVRYYACPEEELLSGKVRMIAQRAFDGCDAALSWHPMTANLTYDCGFLANTSMRFYFKGKTAHAAFSPHLGRSALDAVELMNVGANYLREHVTDKARIHYTSNSGGFPPNIVPDHADSWYFIRAPHMTDVQEIVARLCDVAKGAALMTGTTVEHKTISSCCELLPNQTMAELTRANMAAIPCPVYDAEELRFAQELADGLAPEQLAGDRLLYGTHEPIFSQVGDVALSQRSPLTGSSDSGDVSYLMPMNIFTTACAPLGVTVHTWQMAACAGHSIGQKGMLYAAKILAAVGYDLFTCPDKLQQARADFAAASAARPYCPITPD